MFSVIVNSATFLTSNGYIGCKNGKVSCTFLFEFYLWLFSPTNQVCTAQSSITIWLTIGRFLIYILIWIFHMFFSGNITFTPAHIWTLWMTTSRYGWMERRRQSKIILLLLLLFDNETSISASKVRSGGWTGTRRWISMERLATHLLILKKIQVVYVCSRF